MEKKAKYTNPLLLNGGAIGGIDTNYTIEPYLKKIRLSIGTNTLIKSRQTVENNFLNNFQGMKHISTLQDLLCCVGVKFQDSKQDQLLISYEVAVDGSYKINKILCFKKCYMVMSDLFLQIYNQKLLTTKQKITIDPVNYYKLFNNIAPMIELPKFLKQNIENNMPIATDTLIFDSLFDNDNKANLIDNRYCYDLCLQKIIWDDFNTHLSYDQQFMYKNKLIFDLKQFPAKYILAYVKKNNLKVDEEKLNSGIFELQVI